MISVKVGPFEFIAAPGKEPGNGCPAETEYTINQYRIVDGKRYGDPIRSILVYREDWLAMLSMFAEGRTVLV